MNFINKHKYEILLWFFILTYIVIFSYLSVLRYLSFNSHYYDLGIMHQVVYNTARGRILEMTSEELMRNVSRLAVHFDPILATFAPFYWLYPRPEILLIAQSIIIALGTLGLYLLALKILKNKLYSLIFAFVYLNYYPLQNANLFDFHAVMFLPTFLIWAFYLAEIRKFKLSLLLIVLSLLTKENVGLTTFLLGLYFLIFKKEKKFGLTVSVISLAIFFMVVFLVIPYFRQGSHFALKYYSFEVGNILTRLFSLDSLNYLINVLSPLVFLSLLSPTLLLISLPDFMINLLSSNTNMRELYFQYTAVIIPFIIISTIYGFDNCLRINFRFKRILTKAIIFLLLFLNLYLAYLQGPLARNTYALDSNKLKTVYIWQKILKSDNHKIATTPRLAPFFSGRRYYYNFLFDPGSWGMGIKEDDIIKTISKYENADYAIIARSEVNQANSLQNKYYQHLQSNTKFKLIFEDKEIEVYKNVKYYYPFPQ